MRTNLETGLGEACETGNLREALSDSCAFPFAFRSFESHCARYVDGGLCDNLPVMRLREKGAEPIFAVYPHEENTRNDTRGLFKYGLALMSVGISNSVAHSLQSIEEGFRMPVKVEYSTFDFESALAAFANDDWYQKTYKEALRKIRNFAKSYGHTVNMHQVRVTDARFIDDYATMLSRITSDYSSHAQHISAELKVRVNCRERQLDKRPDVEREADTIIRRARLRVTSEKFRYYRSSMGAAGSGTQPTIWRAYKANEKNELPIIVLSVGKIGAKATACVIEFKEPEKHIKVGDELIVESTAYLEEAMRGMNNGRSEYVRFENPHGYELQSAVIKLEYPPELGQFEMLINESNCKGLGQTEPIDPERPDLDTMILGMRAYGMENGGVLYCDVVMRAR